MAGVQGEKLIFAVDKYVTGKNIFSFYRVIIILCYKTANKNKKINIFHLHSQVVIINLEVSAKFLLRLSHLKAVYYFFEHVYRTIVYIDNTIYQECFGDRLMAESPTFCSVSTVSTAIPLRSYRYAWR